jgi:hypothetical protein
MIEWSLFYKILGIPEDVTRPTHYDLLGLSPNVCSSELVEDMLNKQKSRLRQNIPGPQFIPFVLIFEQRELERAAAVLGDDAVREKYDKYLQRNSWLRKFRKKREWRRQQLLQQAHDVVTSLVNPDKTLDDSKRPILAASLRSLGLKESMINSLLERIPGPAKNVAKPSDEAVKYFVTAIDLAIRSDLLTPVAEHKIMDLARNLNIDEDQANNMINQELKNKNARRGKREVSLLQQEFKKRLVTMFPNGSVPPDQYELLLALAEADGLSVVLAKEVLQKHLAIQSSEPTNEGRIAESAKSTGQEQVVVDDESRDSDALVAIDLPKRKRDIWPIAMSIVAIGIFVFSIWCFQMGVRDFLHWWMSSTQPKLPTSTNGVGSQPPSGRDQPSPAPGIAPGPEGSARERQTPKGEDPHSQRPPGSISQPTTSNVPSPTKRTAPIQKPLEIRAKDIRQVYSATTGKEELLGQVALTVFACYCRTTHFASRSTACYDELSKLMDEAQKSKSDLADYLTGKVTVTPIAVVPAQTQSPRSAPATSKIKAKTKVSPSYIEKLRMEDTPEAADKLLSELERRCLLTPQSNTEITCRILRALSTMTVLNIPQRLIRMLPWSNPQAAFHIALTLAKAAGNDAIPGLLPLDNGPARRKMCASWWKNNVPKWPKASSPTPRIVAAPWEPDLMIIKLLAVTAHFAELSRDVLKDYKWGAGTPTQTARFDTDIFMNTYTPDTIGPRLLDSLDEIFRQLSRLVIAYPAYETDPVVVSMIKLHQKDPRDAACETTLQKVVVRFDSITELLKLLILQADPTLKEKVDEIEAAQQKALLGSYNVMHELRESCYYNLVLWDMLIDYDIGAVEPMQTNRDRRRPQR